MPLQFPSKITAPPGSPRGAFSFRASPLRKYVAPIVRGPLLSHDLALSTWQRARNYRPHSSRTRNGSARVSGAYLLRMHIRYP